MHSRHHSPATAPPPPFASPYSGATTHSAGWLQVIALKKIPQKPRNDKPIRIPIPHPIYATEDVEVCLFVKDQKGERRCLWMAAYGTEFAHRILFVCIGAELQCGCCV